MNVMKSLWASIQGDPVFMRRVNGWLTIFWIVMIPVSISLGLLSSVAYVSALSLWALVSGHWSAWQAARVEVAQAAEAEAQEEHPVEERVVNKMIERTNVTTSSDKVVSPETFVARSDEMGEQATLAMVIERLDAISADLADIRARQPGFLRRASAEPLSGSV